MIVSVAGVRKGRGKELGRETAREGGGRRVPFLSPSRAQIPTSPFNACHAGYQHEDESESNVPPTRRCQVGLLEGTVRLLRVSLETFDKPCKKNNLRQNLTYMSEQKWI